MDETLQTATAGQEAEDSCHGLDCTNPPAVSVGNLRLCDDCLGRVRADYPMSFAAYWQPKIVPLTEAGAEVAAA